MSAASSSMTGCCRRMSRANPFWTMPARSRSNSIRGRPPFPPLVTDLGSNGQPLDLTGDITLAAGSLLDLDGGGQVLSNGQLQTVSNGVPPASAAISPL